MARLSTFFEKLVKANGKKIDSLVYPIDNVDEIQYETPHGFVGLSSQYYSFSDKSNKIKEKIKTYRRMANDPEIASAIDEIVNDAIVIGDEDFPIKLDIHSDSIGKKIIEKILEEFKYICKLLNLDSKAQEIFRRWYIDGRLIFYLHYNKQRNNIDNIFVVDPTKILKKRKIKIERDSDNIPKAKEYVDFYEYYIDDGRKVLLPEENFVVVYSGITDEDGVYVSYLEQAIKIWNQLSMLEDAIVIYRISRAPERRVFYIDTGNMPASKAQQYIRKLMNDFRSKMVYDVKTGKITNERGVLSMIEDIWLARRADGRGTEIETLPGGQNLGEIDDVLYFRKKLYKALKIPSTRLDTENSILQIRATEISREEVKFSRFIDSLRKKFASGILEVLKRQLLAKKIIKESDWKKLYIKTIFANDNLFIEQKNAELWNMKFELMNNADNFVGKFISRETFMKKVLNFTDEEYQEEIEKINKERETMPKEEDRYGRF